MSWWQWLCDAVFPERCIICKREGAWFCERHDKFPAAPSDESRTENLDKIWAATAYYHPTARKSVEFFKFRGFTSLADKFGDIITDRIPAEEFQNSVIIPVPLHWTRQLWRGFNQAEKIAAALVNRNKDSKLSLELKRVRRTKQQALLSKMERHQNLKDAFSWMGESAPEKVILVDDVVASGGTLDAAAAILREAGVKKVVGVVFARGGKPCENLDNEN